MVPGKGVDINKLNKKLQKDINMELQRATKNYEKNYGNFLQNKIKEDLLPTIKDFYRAAIVVGVLDKYCKNIGLPNHLYVKKIIQDIENDKSASHDKMQAAHDVYVKYQKMLEVIDALAEEMLDSIDNRYGAGKLRPQSIDFTYASLKIIGCIGLFFGACKVFMENIAPNIKLAFSNEPGKTIAIIALGLAAGSVSLSQIIKISTPMSEYWSGTDISMESKEIINNYITEDFASQFGKVAESLTDYEKTQMRNVKQTKTERI